LSEITNETFGQAETESLGEELGSELAGGETVVLTGELGTGKTAFIRGLARGLGVDDPDHVRSPSYALMLRYKCRVPLLHIDAYFMKCSEDLDLCGIEDALARGDVVAVEWGDRVASGLPRDSILVSIRQLAPERREVTVRRERLGGPVGHV